MSPMDCALATTMSMCPMVVARAQPIGLISNRMLLHVNLPGFHSVSHNFATANKENGKEGIKDDLVATATDVAIEA